MYSDKKSILQLIALLKAHGIRKVVLCPGSRNAPILHTLFTHPDFTCYSVTDERSAGYFAMGLSLHDGCPVAVCCTSGTALLNLHPAVAEAFYQYIPLVVISADRPSAWIGQMDGQTLPQSGVFQALVKKSVNLPEIHSEEDSWYCNRLINEALLAVTHHGKGPVHINIPISEPLFRFTVNELPRERVIRRYRMEEISDEEYSKLFMCLNDCKRRMVVVGQMPFDSSLKPENPFIEQFVWLSEHIANGPYSFAPLSNFDVALYTMSDEMKRRMAPDLLITYGGHIVSKRLKQFLRHNSPKEHWHISPDGEVVDLFGSLTVVIEGNPQRFLEKAVTFIHDDGSEYVRKWEMYCGAIPEPVFPYSEMGAIGTLLRRLPKGSVLHLANSSAVRYAQLYSLSSTVEVHCNRGTSGIEGSLSTAVGYAACTDRLNFVVIGDLSFFYDMNALWNNHISTNLRILLLNNGGGEIFYALPGLDMTNGSYRFITATHTTSAKGWAEERGFLYLPVADEGGLNDAMTRFCASEAERPMLMEVFTDGQKDIRLLKEYYHQLKRE